MGLEENLIGTDLSSVLSNGTSIIKVIGVGGGGGNAVNHMFNQGIVDVSFVVCNTDQQALAHSPVQHQIVLGTEGLGAGGRPENAKFAVEQSLPQIENMLQKSPTKMVFITAGMGGGTGTGAAPVIAKVAHDLGILTVGIVTIPFAFEGKQKINQALRGVLEMSKNVDALLVVNNEKLCKIYPDLTLRNAFSKANEVLTVAAKGIAEIITVHGEWNVDFADVNTIMKNSGVAIMNTGIGEGENRVMKAIEDALNSPLLDNTDVRDSKKILLNICCSEEKGICMDEIRQVNDFMAQMGEDIEVISGVTFDNSLGEKVRITIIATGFSCDSLPKPSNVKDVENQESEIDRARAQQYENIHGEKQSSLEMHELEELDDDALLAEIQNVPTYQRM